MTQWLWLVAVPFLLAAFFIGNLTVVRAIAVVLAAVLGGWGAWLLVRLGKSEGQLASLQRDVKSSREEIHQQRQAGVDAARLRDKTEEQRKALEERLKLSQQELEAIPAAMVIVTAEGRIIRLNREAEAVTGWSTAELANRDWNEIFSRPGQAGVRREGLLGNEEQAQVAEDVVVAKDGRELLMASRLWRLREKGLVGWAFFPRAAAADYGRLMDQFVTNISHELRTPLTVMKGYAEILYEDSKGKDDEQTTELLKVVLDENERLSSILEGVLNFRQATSGEIGLKHEDVDMLKLLKAVTKDMEPRFKAKNIALVRNLPESITPCRGDFNAYRFAFSQMLDNAAKFTPDGGTVTVETGIPKLDDGVWKLEVRVKDTGVGIAPADLPHIFERFYRSDQKVHTLQGTGIGLSVVKEIIETNGGTISVDSAVGKGSVFTVLLPMPG